MKNYGKIFEQQIAKQLGEVEGIFLYRLHDDFAGFSGVANISDFFFFNPPYLVALECKSCGIAAFNIGAWKYKKSKNGEKKLSGQYSQMMEAHKKPNVICGLLIHFYSYENKCYFIPFQEVLRLEKMGYKSISIREIEFKVIGSVQLFGEIKRKYYTWDMNMFKNDMKELGKDIWENKIYE